MGHSRMRASVLLISAVRILILRRCCTAGGQQTWDERGVRTDGKGVVEKLVAVSRGKAGHETGDDEVDGGGDG